MAKEIVSSGIMCNLPIDCGKLNISNINLYDLCIGCGVCESVCPMDAIKIVLSEGVYSPQISKKTCNNCGLCLATCPGFQVNYEKLNNFCFDNSPRDHFLGSFKSCYYGQSTDSEIRWMASSGGIVTTILSFALKNGLINGAVVCISKGNNPMIPKVIVARNNEEIRSSLGSKYCPIPVGIALKEIANSEGKFAVVGLPCHLHGIRVAESLYPSLRDKIVLHIGLFCSNMITFDGTYFLLNRLNIRPKEVIALSYRCRGWPGEMVISLKNGKEKSVPYEKYWDTIFGLNFFTPWRCFSCADATSEFADISVGDPWLPQFKNEKKGKSIMIARTRAGEELLKKAQSERSIIISLIDDNLVKNSQIFTLKSKKKVLNARRVLLKLLHKTLPLTYPLSEATGLITYLPAALTIFPKLLSSHNRFRVLMRYMPFPVLKAYFKLVSATLLIIK